VSIPRPKIYFLRGDDPEKYVDDPALAHLAAAGWTLGAVQYVQVDGPGGAREPRLMLILWPPAVPNRVQPPWLRVVEVLALVAIAAGAWAMWVAR
jgi:hypothetical protein